MEEEGEEAGGGTKGRAEKYNKFKNLSCSY